MKEIKFRALWTDGYCEPKWVYGYLTERDRNILIDPGGEEGAFIIITKHENSVGQYTGLKDKNGKEIFEGDVVEAIRYDGLVVTGVVGFRDCSFVISTGYQTIYTWMDYQIEIIGNIHENPELLEGD